MATTAYFGELPFKTFAITTTDYSGVDGSSYPYQFRAVMHDHSNAGNMVLPASTPTSAPWQDSNSNNFAGIMVNAPKANEAAQIVVLGETKVIAGAAFSANVPLTFNANGFIIAATSTDLIIGISRIAAGAEGDIVTAIINALNFSGY
jgi:hypothetical protein